MKLSLSFLRDYVPTPLDAEQTGDVFTMIGFELEETFESEGEDCLDINIMANRGDAASVFGLAREFAAKRPEDGETALMARARDGFQDGQDSQQGAAEHARVSIETDACTRYACRVFLDVENGESPDWLKTRLVQSGQRPISLLVDLTNYVMLETGQPLHAFDLDKLAGSRIIVRQAREGETLATLDGQERALQPHHMVIADADRAVAVAGVMGGADTEVGPETKRCLLESAHFVNTSVRRTRKELGLQTEASYRFERHVDPSGVTAALRRFTELYQQITEKGAVPGTLDLWPIRPEPRRVSLDMARARKLLALDVTSEGSVGHLQRLGFAAKADGDIIAAEVPTWRADIFRSDDLIEEIGRMHGYEKFPELPPAGSTLPGGTHGIDALAEALSEAALRAGLNQAVSHTLGDKHPLDAACEKIRVRTPHSPEMAALRSSLLPALAEAIVRNGAKDQHWFEEGHVFSPGRESRQIAFIMTGSQEPVHPAAKPSEADFFRLKGVVQALAKAARVQASFQPASSDQRFHPSRQAVLVSDSGQACGVFGQIHPDAALASGLPAQSFAAELDISALFEAGKETFGFRPVSRNPAARRDIAIVAPIGLAYQQIEAAVAQTGGSQLEKHWLFDIYEGKGIPEGFRSLAIGLQLRKQGANFTDEEANQARDQILEALAALGATVRQ